MKQLIIISPAVVYNLKLEINILVFHEIEPCHRKSVFGVWCQVKLQLVYSATYTSKASKGAKIRDQVPHQVYIDEDSNCALL